MILIPKRALGDARMSFPGLADKMKPTIGRRVSVEFVNLKHQPRVLYELTEWAMAEGLEITIAD